MSDTYKWPAGPVVILPHQLSLLLRSQDLCLFPVGPIQLENMLGPHQQMALKGAVSTTLTGLLPSG